jgi:DNA-directed RNA polymerase specialized sigma24 family protein
MNDIAGRLYEQLLVLRCQTGDGGAFGELVERFAVRLRYYVRSLLGKERRADAEDVLEDVWLDVYRSIATLIPTFRRRRSSHMRSRHDGCIFLDPIGTRVA